MQVANHDNLGLIRASTGYQIPSGSGYIAQDETNDKLLTTTTKGR